MENKEYEYELIEEENLENIQPIILVEEENDSYDDENLENDRSYYKNNLENKFRQIKKNQEISNKLSNRKINTMNKNGNIPKTSPGMSTPSGLGRAPVGASTAGTAAAGTAAAGTAAAGTAAAGTAAAGTAAAGTAAAGTVAGGWIIILIIVVLILLVVIFWAVFSDSSSGSSGSSSSNIEYIEGYGRCNSITVTASDGGGGGVYSLEEYVAGVLVHENHWYEGDNIENMKAQAVVARTYAISRTNNCKNPIPNSQSTQTFYETTDAYAIRAAEETAGQILMTDGKLLETEYDALAIASEDDKNYYLKQQNVAIQKSWLDSRISESEYEWYAKYNHGRGMSQWGSRYLQTQGYTYDEILSTFYVNSELFSISQTTSTNGSLIISNGGFPIRSIQPDIYALPDQNYYNDTNWFQCPWYAKGRAIEILSTVKMEDEEARKKAIGAVRASNGNGSDWYSLSQNGGTLSMFSSSKDYKKPKAGAIISWKWTDAHYAYKKANGAGANYGHVAIIESVEGNEVIVTDGWNICGGYNKSSGCQGFAHRKVNIEYLKHFGGNYDFIGYVYLLD